MFFSHLPKDGIAEETIKLAHHLAQTPSAYRNVSQNLEIEKCMNKLIQLKDSGAIGGCPCNLGTCWTFQKSEIEKHFIGNISGSANQFRVFGDIICEGTAPSMHEAIVGINRSLGTILGSMESMIEVPHDVCEHLNFSPMFEYSRAWITSRYELIYGLKNAENKLELFCTVSRETGFRKNITFPANAVERASTIVRPSSTSSRGSPSSSSSSRGEEDAEDGGGGDTMPPDRRSHSRADAAAGTSASRADGRRGSRRM